MYEARENEINKMMWMNIKERENGKNEYKNMKGKRKWANI
jgi:hypothetical protein